MPSGTGTGRRVPFAIYPLGYINKPKNAIANLIDKNENLLDIESVQRADLNEVRKEKHVKQNKHHQSVRKHSRIS